MEYGRLSGKLHSDEDWLASPGPVRELIVSAWSWAIDHDREDGVISWSVLVALSAGLGHGDHDDYPAGPTAVVKDLESFGWIDPVKEGRTGEFLLRGWEPQAELIRKARERREKERERYQRRKGGSG